jgi:hypothetical protein
MRAEQHGVAEGGGVRVRPSEREQRDAGLKNGGLGKLQQFGGAPVRNSQAGHWLSATFVVGVSSFAGAWFGTLLGALANHFGYREMSVEVNFPLRVFFSGGIVMQVAFSMLLYAPVVVICYLLLRRIPQLTAAWLSFLYFLVAVFVVSSRWFAASTGLIGIWQYLAISSIPIAISFIVWILRRRHRPS